MKETNTTSTEEGTTTIHPGNNYHVSGRPRKPKESGENAKGTLIYEAETRTWQCAQREKKYAEKDAREGASNVETHTRTNMTIRRQQEQQIIQENAYRNSDETRLRTLLHYGEEKRGTLKKRHPGSIHSSTRTEEATRTEWRRTKPS